jgi:phosphoglycerol transferase
MKNEKKKMPKFLSILGNWVICGLIYGCLLVLFAALWYVGFYGKTGFDSIIFSLYAGLRGAETGLISRFLIWAVLPTLLLGSLLIAFVFLRPKHPIRFWPSRRCAGILAALICLGSVGYAMTITGAVDHTLSLHYSTTIFEDAYVDPMDVEITFPEEKRNLIIIYLESVETTFYSRELGGAMKQNLIPELWELARDNVSFSHTQGPGGFRSVGGTTWTTGGIVGQSSGAPLKHPLVGSVSSEEGVFLPGMTMLMDILHDNGYYQELIVGSDVSFGEIEALYASHGTDRIRDVYTAYDDGIAPQDYYVWWGMEDAKVFAYAKQELETLSALDQPFALTLQTIDTHHVGGYVCPDCPTTYEEQYSNVLSCSSARVAAFVDWLRQQPYYDDTTIVICGDHPSMDNVYIKHLVPDDYVRRVYNCFINPAAVPVSRENREFTTLDIFPTTLAALGCTISGNRLGLGTDLFSGRPTLAEEMGYDEFNRQVSGSSEFYSQNFYREPNP